MADEQFSSYELQRSGNGTDFVTIATSTDKSWDDYTDKNPLNGSNYYRVKASDKDNSFRYSKTVHVIYEHLNQLNIYPNPVQSQLNISLANMEAGWHQFDITDLSGKPVYQQKIMMQNGGNTIQVNTKEWAAQVYLIQLKDKTGTVVKSAKFLKQ